MQIPIESLNFLMLNVGYAKHNADWNWKNVSSPFTRVFCVTEGSAWLHIYGEKIQLIPNHLYIIPANTQHSYECDGVFEHYYLHFYEGFKKETDVFEYYDFPVEVDMKDGDVELFQQMCKLHPEACLPDSNPISYDNHTKFVDFVKRYNNLPLYEKMNLRGMMLIIFSRFMENAKQKMWVGDERIETVIETIHKNIYQPIELETLASQVCITKPYLIRVFKRNFGTSPLQYINQKKMERAQLLLMTTDVHIKEVAYKLGFNDHSYFIRLFKKMMGITPQEYRNSMK